MQGAVPVAEAQAKAPADLKAVAAFLRGKHGPKIRRGVLNGKRVDYFKGKSAIKQLLSPAYKKVKKVPVVENAEEATALLARMLPSAFFLRTDRPTPDTPPASGQPKLLQMCPQQSFSPDAYYTWFLAGSPLGTIIGGVVMILVMFVGVLFPLWPPIMRMGVYYLSLAALGLIGAFFGIAVLRLIFWMITSVVCRKGIWVFPNLFEDVSVVDSFKPFWAWDEPPPKKSKKSGAGFSKTSSKSTKANAGTKLAAGLAKSPLIQASAANTPGNTTPALQSEDELPNGSQGQASTAVSPEMNEVNGGKSEAGPESEQKVLSVAAEKAKEGGGEANMRRRQQAYVEDVEDRE